ncbi:MAG: hypothetical protein WC730_02955 [Patescibacteria group bacterium]|jgi:hypothetical protein
MKTRDILFLFVILLTLGGLFFYFNYAPPADDELDYHPVDVGGGSLTIADQDQTNLVVFGATLAAPGFVTIHESMSGAPAAVIGTSEYLPAGTHEMVVISLDEFMTPGYSYIALLHADNGDEAFVMEEDFPVIVDGTVVKTSFVTMPESVE